MSVENPTDLLTGLFEIQRLQEIEVSPMSVDFGIRSFEDGPTSPVTVTIRNLGSDALDVTSIDIVDDIYGSFSLVGVPAIDTLTGSETIEMQILFSPVIPGTVDASLRILSNDPFYPTLDVPLDGEGLFTGNHVYVDFDYSGTEYGTEIFPFNTLADAFLAGNPGATVRIEPGTTNFTGTLSGAVRLESTGGSVRIGVLE
jgi:hypothetical protein